MSYDRFSGILLSNPKFFDVSYKINPYMQGNVDKHKSWSEWSEIVRKFRKHNMQVNVVDYQTYDKDDGSIEDLPDIVFVANHAMPIPNGFILSNMDNAEREPEPYYFNKWAKYNHYNIITLSDHLSFEGCGDAKWHPEKNKVWMGYGPRTDERAVDQVDSMLESEVEKLQLETDDYYHLDVCFEPLSADEAVYIPEAFSSDSVEILKNGFDNLIEVCEEDKNTMAGNCALVEKNTVFIDKINSSTGKKLRSEGYNTIYVDTEEFMKAGGSVDCLFVRIP